MDETRNTSKIIINLIFIIFSPRVANFNSSHSRINVSRVKRIILIQIKSTLSNSTGCRAQKKAYYSSRSSEIEVGRRRLSHMCRSHMFGPAATMEQDRDRKKERERERRDWEGEGGLGYRLDSFGRNSILSSPLCLVETER